MRKIARRHASQHVHNAEEIGADAPLGADGGQARGVRVGCVVAARCADGEGEDVEDVEALKLVPALVWVWVACRGVGGWVGGVGGGAGGGGGCDEEGGGV